MSTYICPVLHVCHTMRSHLFDSISSQNFLIFAAAFYGNLGNYKSFGDTKFVPDLPKVFSICHLTDDLLLQVTYTLNNLKMNGYIHLYHFEFLRKFCTLRMTHNFVTDLPFD